MLDTIGNYTFKDPGLLKLALTHRSVSPVNYERLEYLGDALLGAYVTEMLFRTHPDVPEGDLSRMRSHLVCTTSLSKFAKKLGIQNLLIVNSKKFDKNYSRSTGVLADVFEAILAAVYLDGGHVGAGLFIIDQFRDSVVSIPPAEALKDTKTQLQEITQSWGDGPPIYTLVENSGPSHHLSFKVSTDIRGQSFFGVGGSIREAEKDCAGAAIKSLVVTI